MRATLASVPRRIPAGIRSLPLALARPFMPGTGQNALPSPPALLPLPAHSGPQPGERGGGVRVRSGVRGAVPRYLDSSREYLGKPLSRNILRDTVTALRACAREHEAELISACGSVWRVFASRCGTKKLVRASCDHALCPECQRARSLPLQRKVLSLTRATGKVFRFITLTAQNVPLINRGYVDWLIQCFAKLRKMDTWVSRIRGGVYSIETTYSLSRFDWHVHLHVIVEAERSLPQSWIFYLRRDWLAATNGAGAVVHMRAVNRRAVRELVKYQAKAVTLLHHPALVDEYLRTFHHVRRLQCFGTFLGADVAEPEKPGFKCACGLCRRGDWSYLGEVPDAETICAPGGERQMRFDYQFDWQLASVKLSLESVLVEYPAARHEKGGWLRLF